MGTAGMVHSVALKGGGRDSRDGQLGRPQMAPGIFVAIPDGEVDSPQPPPLPPAWDLVTTLMHECGRVILWLDPQFFFKNF